MRRLATANDPKLQTITDAQGTLSYGWVGEGVFYALSGGHCSAGLGQEYASRLEALLKDVSHVQYFADASGLKSYDMLARSAFFRVLLPNRRKFKNLVLLVQESDAGPYARTMADAVGSLAEVLTDGAEFRSRLLRAAPLAGRAIGADAPISGTQSRSHSKKPSTKLERKGSSGR